MKMLNKKTRYRNVRCKKVNRKAKKQRHAKFVVNLGEFLQRLPFVLLFSYIIKLGQISFINLCIACLVSFVIGINMRNQGEDMLSSI